MLSHSSLTMPHFLVSTFACLMLAGCVTAPPPQSATPANKEISLAEGNVASVLRTGYRWAKAGQGDQIVIPPERFMVTGVDGAPLERDGRMLALSSGLHSFEIMATGGPFRGTGQIKARLQAGADYQVTGFLDSRGAAAFIVWLEDTLTHQPASPRQKLDMSRIGTAN